MLTRPRGLPEGVAALIGSALVLATGSATLGDLGQVLRQNATVLAFFLGMMTLTTLAEGAGVFDRLAGVAARLAGGSAKRLFLNVFVLGTLISTFLTNDATALILTPVVYALVTGLRLDPLPYVFACTFIADTASTTLPISNPINIILAQRFAGLDLVSFLHYLLLPSLAAIAINVLLFYRIFWRKLGQRFAAPEPRRRGAADDRAFRFAVVCLVVTGIAFVTAAQLRPQPIGAVAVAGGGALLVATWLQGRLQWAELGRGISWSIFPFIAGMFLLVRALERQGAIGQLGSALAHLAGHGTLQPVIASTFFSAITSNLINNVPTVAAMNAAIPTIHGVAQPALVYGTLIGCDLGPNLTVVGSLSTMIWLLLLRQRRLEVSALDYARYGVIVTPLMLLLSALVLVLLLR